MSTPFGPQGLTSNDPTRNGSAPVSAGAFICPTPEPVRPVEGRNSVGRPLVGPDPARPFRAPGVPLASSARSTVHQGGLL